MLQTEKFVEDSEMQYKCLVKLAMNNKVSWTSLKTFIHELTSDFKGAIKLNDVLLDELQSAHSKLADYQIQGKDKEIENEKQITVENGSDQMRMLWCCLPNKKKLRMNTTS